MNIGAICHKDVVTAKPEATAHEALQLMKDRHVGTVVVVEENRVTGIVTDRDIALRSLAQHRLPDAVSLQEIMTPNPVTVQEDASVHTAIRLLCQYGVRRLPILDPQGRLVGLASLDDLVLLLGKELYELAAAVASELQKERRH